MNNTVNITIPRSDVFGRVRTEASYMGSKIIESGLPADADTSQPTPYERISIAETDYILVGKMMEDSFHTLIDAVEDYVDMECVQCSADPFHFRIRLDMPGNFDNGKSERLKSTITEFLVSDTLCKWYAYTSKDDAKMKSDEAQGKIAEVQNILCSRKRPMRRRCSYGEFEEVTLD